MAADTRDPSAASNADNTSRPYRGKIYETFTPSTSSSPITQSSPILPPENANAIPGGSTNTAGGRVKEATLWDGIKSIKVEDVQNLHKIPCVRDALLTGMGTGFMIGGGRMILGATMWKSMSWAMGSFCFSSAGMFEFCQRRRALERQGMARAAEIIDRKRLEKERQAEKIRAERRRRREEEEKKKEEEERNKKTGWSLWGQ
ncbi:hypothetical protein MMC34_003132 [Xylographa carneopallida]|nr:hypothetical protein [Xylographa carneopallida]